MMKAIIAILLAGALAVPALWAIEAWLSRPKHNDEDPND